MKRSAYLYLLACVLCLLAACGKQPEPEAPNTQVPSVMLDGVFYRTTGKQMAGEVEESAIIGRINSVVPPSQLPREDGQANFPGLDAPYAMTSDGLVVLVGNEWTLFTPMETVQ